MEFTIDLDLTRLNLPKLKSRSGRVGIIKDSPNGKTTNGVIVAANEREFGWITGLGTFVPPRSTIRLPLEMKEEEIKKAAADAITELDEEHLDKAIEAMGNAALEAIDGAFDTGGYGQWERNAPSTIEKKGRDEPMVDDGILRGAYSFVRDE